MKKIVGSTLAAFTLGVGHVYAAVPAAVTTAASDAGADAITIATAMLIVVAGLLGFKFMRQQMH